MDEVEADRKLPDNGKPVIAMLGKVCFYLTQQTFSLYFITFLTVFSFFFFQGRTISEIHNVMWLWKRGALVIFK